MLEALKWATALTCIGRTRGQKSRWPGLCALISMDLLFPPLDMTVAKKVWKMFSSSGPNLALGFVFCSFKLNL